VLAAGDFSIALGLLHQGSRFLLVPGTNARRILIKTLIFQITHLFFSANAGERKLLCFAVFYYRGKFHTRHAAD
jgi:hypothetical protein